MGGAASAAAATASGGRRSLLAHWAGGAAALPATVQTAPMGGAGSWVAPTGRRRKRRLDDDIEEAAREAYIELRQGPEPVRRAISKIVEPYADSSANTDRPPPAADIDWNELAQHAQAIAKLLELWHKRQEEDDYDYLLLMAG